MTGLRFYSPVRGSQFLGVDSGIEDTALWHDGTKLWLVTGGQSGGWGSRERVWVHDRLPGGPHGDKAYSGYWGRNSFPPLIHAESLRLDGMTLETVASGFPLARLAPGVNTAQWDGEDASWRVQLWDAASGALLFNGLTTARSQTLPTLAAGKSAILRVRVEGIAPAYVWPPPDYTTLAGESEAFPAKFAWTHPTRGKLYYDPRFQVGARPYNTADPVQAALLAQENQALQDGTARKVPEWVKLLVEFDSQGETIKDDGEWSMLRVVVGAGSWIGDGNVHVGATTPSLWRVELDPVTLEPVGAVVPWKLDPTLRCVGALQVKEGGALLVGGAIGGRSGPSPVLYELQRPVDAAGDEAAGEASLALFLCECLSALGKAIRGVAITPSGPRAVSNCDSFRRDLTAGLFARLVPSHPGGRNAVAWSQGENQHYAFSTEGGDFAISKHHQKSNSYVVIEDSRGPRTGAPLGKQLDSCLATLGGKLYGIEEWNDDERTSFEQSLEQRLKSFQALGSSADGAQWDRLAAWPVADFDAGPVARSGSKKEGAALWAFGTTGEGLAMKGRALRLVGRRIERNLECDYFLQRASTRRHGGEDWICGVGLKRGASQFGREQFVLLSKGDPLTVVLTWDGEGFCALKEEWEKWGFDWDDLPPYLIWTGHCWQGANQAPQGGQPYLEKAAGGSTVCYLLHGTAPYDFEDKPGLEWEEGRDCWDPVGASNADEALDIMPDGTKISLCVLSGYEGEISADGAILQGEVGAVAFYPELEHPTLPARQYADLYPYALWLRVDGAPPLVLSQGGAIDHATLAQFDQRAQLETTRSLAVPAGKRVEAALLLAPGWKLKSKILKVRG